MQHGNVNAGGWAVRLVAQYVTACDGEKNNNNNNNKKGWP
jgi:hypothetical protein